MPVTYLPFLLLAVIVAVALFVMPRFACERVPMQWGFDGKPTWYASRRVLSAFYIGLGIFVTAVGAVFAPWSEAVFACGSVLAAQLFHLWLLSRQGRAPLIHCRVINVPL